MNDKAGMAESPPAEAGKYFAAGKVEGLAECAATITDLEAENKQLKNYIRNPGGYRGTTMPTECPLCGQDEAEVGRLREALHSTRARLVTISPQERHGAVVELADSVLPRAALEPRDEQKAGR